MSFGAGCICSLSTLGTGGGLRVRAQGEKIATRWAEGGGEEAEQLPLVTLKGRMWFPETVGSQCKVVSATDLRVF